MTIIKDDSWKIVLSLLFSGPGTEYSEYDVAPQRVSPELLGASQDGDWWQIKVPTSVSPDGTAWVSIDYATAYNTDQLPVPEPLE
ncbi:MAG: hypothetical protein JJE12_08330 [Anaerolineales bacterium]|nr:hypothetical protein [Anaerolineales bacterium]